MTDAAALKTVARLVEEVRPLLGEAGCLLPVWHDPEAVRLLEPLGAVPPFAWRRDARAPDAVRLADPVLGIGVLSGTPEGLADGIEYIAAVADAVLTRLPAAEDPRRALMAKLRRHFATRPPSAPLHVDFVVEDVGPMPGAGHWDIDGWRNDARAPQVEDHRPLGSALSKSHKPVGG